MLINLCIYYFNPFAKNDLTPISPNLTLSSSEICANNLTFISDSAKKPKI